MWVVLWSGSGKTTTANFDGWKVSVYSVGFAHGVAEERVTGRWMSDVVSGILVIIPRNPVTHLD